MNNLFQKLESIQVSAPDMLLPEDRGFCDTLFAAYEQHAAHFKELLDVLTVRYTQHMKKMEGTDANLFRPFKKLKAAVEELTAGYVHATTIFVRRVEEHFETKYNLVFQPLEKRVHLEEQHPLTSYEPIIDNILAQVGFDLTAAGQQQIVKRFEKKFGSTKLAPVIRGGKISLPLYCNLDIRGLGASLDDYNDRVAHLLDVLTLFFYQRTAPTAAVAAQLGCWKNKLLIDHPYPVYPECAIQFFKNRRVDLCFGSAATAGRFWQFASLDDAAGQYPSTND